jgi:hypothetical protein
MLFKIPKQFIFNFSEKLLGEVGIESKAIEDDLESLIYESGERGWEDFEDDDGNEFYIIDFDDF